MNTTISNPHTPLSSHTALPNHTALPTIDMCTPAQACTELGVADDVLLAMINSGRLAAFNLGGTLRLRISDVQTAASALAAA